MRGRILKRSHKLLTASAQFCLNENAKLITIHDRSNILILNSSNRRIGLSVPQARLEWLPRSPL